MLSLKILAFLTQIKICLRGNTFIYAEKLFRAELGRSHPRSLSWLKQLSSESCLSFETSATLSPYRQFRSYLLLNKFEKIKRHLLKCSPSASISQRRLCVKIKSWVTYLLARLPGVAGLSAGGGERDCNRSLLRGRWMLRDG